tara:strand:+ start:415 stop:792 length:378 start_codon:yes stop_codon:yes gene_type:complete
MKRLLLPLLLIGLLLFIFISLVRTDMSSPKAKSSAMKNALMSGIKECIVRDAQNQSTGFSDVFRITQEYFYKIQPIDTNSCFKAKAVPTNDQNTWFEIDYDPGTGKTSKTCGDSSKQGCEEGNTW